MTETTKNKEHDLELMKNGMFTGMSESIWAIASQMAYDVDLIRTIEDLMSTATGIMRMRGTTDMKEEWDRVFMEARDLIKKWKKESE